MRHGDEVGVDKMRSSPRFFAALQLSNSTRAERRGAVCFSPGGCWISGRKYFCGPDLDSTIILLNGIGSAGKSSIAKAIQEQARGTFLHVPMDAWLEMMPRRSLGTPDGLAFETVGRDGKPVVVVTSGPEQERALKGMRHAVAAMAALGCNMVVDEVIFDAAAMAEYRALLKPYRLHVVGVHAPLEVLEARERARGNREIGLARGQFGVVHKGVTYDFEVDTSTATAEDCAAAVVARFGL